ncbi:MAG: protein-export chaperone SecB [Gammaproteobacteria bacterium]|nr:protein-export chaperone SecB [Gammaproteobacteria bacterium]
MTEAMQESNGNGSTQSGQFALKKLYIKDLSFESPNAPAIFEDPGVASADPQVKLNLKNSHKSLGDNHCEVVLHVSVHATLNDKSLFMVEIEQAGVFKISGYSDAEKKKLIGTHCPSALFPYAREAVSSLIGKGGFPAMLLQPINFDAIYAQITEDTVTAGSA